MPNKKIVLDTNCLLASISRRSTAYPAWKGFQEGRYTLCVTNEILAEYEEMIARMASADVATNVIRMIMDSRHVDFIDTYYHWNLITANPDDKGGAARLPSVSWREPVRGLRFCRRSHLHRVGRFAL